MKKNIYMLILAVFLVTGCSQDENTLSANSIKEIETIKYGITQTGDDIKPGLPMQYIIESFNDAGHLIEKLHKDSDGKVYSRVVTTYDENNNEIEKTEYGVDNSIIAVEILAYEKGNLIKIEYFSDGELTRYTEFEYPNEQEKIVTYYDSLGSIIFSNEQFFESEFKTIVNYSNEKENVKTTSEYVKDDLGNIIEFKTIAEDNTLISETHLTYDKFNNVIKNEYRDYLDPLKEARTSDNIISVSGNSEIIFEQVFEYDNHGNYIKCNGIINGELHSYEERVIKYWN